MLRMKRVLPMMRRPLQMACILVVAIATSSAAATNFLVNGTFDTAVPDNGTGGGWTSATISTSYGWNAGWGNPAPAYVLNHTGQVGSDPKIFQTVAGLAPGSKYVIYGDYDLLGDTGTPNNSFEVRVDGTAILSIGPHPADVPGYTGQFAQFSIEFTATATSHQIMFAAECNGSDHHYLVDNLVMETTVAVESSTWGKVKALYR